MSLRIAPTLAAAALTAAGLTFVPSAAHAATTTPTPEATATAQWLAKSLSTGVLHNDQYDFDDIGGSADAGLALAATGELPATVAKVADAAAGRLSEWVGDGTTESYAGSLGKAAVFFDAAGTDPTDVDGVNLITRLESQVLASGRIQDVSAYGDYANSFGQAFAVQALTDAQSSKAAPATDFLIDQQCSDGWFRTFFNSTDSSCDPATDGADTDVTALAASVLLRQGGNADAATAASDALKWLKKNQAADGGFGGGADIATENADSTGLAAVALAAGGETQAAERAAEWIASHMADSTACEAAALRSDAGAIAYDATALTAGQKDGITVDTKGQWWKATTDALPALALLPASAPALSAPSGFVAGGSTIPVKVSGARAGQQTCLSGGVAPVRVAGNRTVSVKLPTSTARRTLTLSSFGAAKTASVSVLGAAKLHVAAPKKVKRGKSLKVVVFGLASGERVTVRLGKKTLGTVVAGSSGSATLRKKVAKRTAAGTRKLVVTGAFANRTGGKKVKVTR